MGSDIAYILDSKGQSHRNFVIVYSDGDKAMHNTVGAPVVTKSEIDSLRKELAEAKNKALEESAIVALALKPTGGGKLLDERRAHAFRIAAAIRSLKDTTYDKA